MISDEAVHAAASAVYGSGLDGSPVKDAWLADFRKALEAAAPHMTCTHENEAFAAARVIAELHGPHVTSLVGRRIDGEEFQEIAGDSFDEIVSRSVVCMTCQGYPGHPCATYAMATEVLT